MCQAGFSALSSGSCGQAQLPRVVPQVVCHEGRNEVVAVVIARMAMQSQWLAGFGAGCFKQFGVQLLGEEFVVQPLVYAYAARVGRCRHKVHQRGGVVLRPV
jgi:hypothetical protein